MNVVSNAFGVLFVDLDASRVLQRAPSPACGGGSGWGHFAGVNRSKDNSSHMITFMESIV
jgi:hypothetical protein